VRVLEEVLDSDFRLLLRNERLGPTHQDFGDKMAVYSFNDSLMCLIFSSNLKSETSNWFYSLPPHSLCNFEVSEAFRTQNTSRQEAKRNNHHILIVKMRQDAASNPTSDTPKANCQRSSTVVEDVPALAFISELQVSHPHVQTSHEAQCHSDERGLIPRLSLHPVGGGNEEFRQPSSDGW